ncbi:GlcG/HbpS family heme-binding protein [Micromonospora tulbaghiae]|uniref:GlcG/HbpS family heme-binding protein n=1 Tax=Micromonospora tulbaghiae TaxID=479978 RepID=UPI00340D66F0
MAKNPHVVKKRSISAPAARAMVAAAVARAEEMGFAVTVAVCDESGVLKAYERMDGAPLVSVQLAQDKAYTAVGFGLSSDGWYDFIKDDGPLAMGAPPAIDRLVTFGGGYPVKVDDVLVGGIGVSGGHYTQDMEVAQAGLKALP